jgi:hypothetical protein
MKTTGHIWRMYIRGYAKPILATRVIADTSKQTYCIGCGKAPAEAGASCGKGKG